MPASMKSSTTQAVAEISRLDLQDLSAPAVVSISNVRHLSSYNWIEAPTPCIAIPGSPPLWSPPRIPQQLKKDSGHYYIAQNAARHPESPLEPLFRALYAADPSFDIRLIDVVTDRNNVRKLLSFINPGSSRNGLESFTINIEITKDTAILSRNEIKTHNFIKPHEFRGYGHEFEKVYTTSHIRGSTGHHRVISYHFGGLFFIVRYETDGYVGINTKVPSTISKGMDSEDLSNMLGSLTVHPSQTTPDSAPAESKLTIKEDGQEVPLESILEIKTRVAHKPLEFQEIAAQLWISQTPKLVRAYHNKGIFQEPEVEDVVAKIKSWEEGNQTHLQKLAALIKKLIVVVKGCGGSAIVKYDDKADKLVICKVEGERMLPKDLYSKWDDEDIPKAQVDTDGGDGAIGTVKSVDGVEVKEDNKDLAPSVTEKPKEGS